MKKNKDRIYIKSWLNYKPYVKQVISDSYYLKLCNKVCEAIYSYKNNPNLNIIIDNNAIEDFSCFITSYFEDLISGTNIWNTFIKLHEELYNKPLPFYDTVDYCKNEINQHDISFLIWYYFNNDEDIMFPNHENITKMAKVIYDVFDKEWEYAPENEFLKSFYKIDENETDFYEARNLMDKILFDSYLFQIDTYARLMEEEIEVMNENKDDVEHKTSLLYEVRASGVHNYCTRLLALKSNEWSAHLLGKNHPLYNDFLNMSPRICGFFYFIGQDDYDIFIEHIATGKKFKLTKKSLNTPDLNRPGLFKIINEILLLGIVKWRNEWWISGSLVKSDYNAKLVNDEVTSIDSRKQVDFLDYQFVNVEDMLNQQKKVFMEFTNGKQIYFINADNVERFSEKYFMFSNTILKLSRKSKKKVIEDAINEGILYDENNINKSDFPKDIECAVVFFNDKSGVEFNFEVYNAFNLPNNYFYDKSLSFEHTVRLFTSEDLSTELAKYCVEKCKSDLEFFEGEEGKVYDSNFDFLLRYWKHINYWTYPSISLIGSAPKNKSQYW